MASTASTTSKVKVDILRQLGIENTKGFISSFNRPGLAYDQRSQIVWKTLQI